jgi:hypothetical protein
LAGSERRLQTYSPSWLWILISVCVAIGLGISSLLLPYIRDYWVQREVWKSYSQTTAVVLACSRDWIDYEYSIDGQQMQGRDYFSSSCSALPILPIVYYSLQDPTQSSFGAPRDFTVGFVSIGLIFGSYSLMAGYVGLSLALTEIQSRIRDRRLEREGLLLPAEIIQIKLQRVLWWKLRLRFETPDERILEVEDQTAVRPPRPYRPNTSDPKIGTRVYVLYASDRCYRVL